MLQIGCFLLVWSGIHAEIFSALSGMEALLKTEGTLLESLHTYVQYQEDQLQLLKKSYEDYLDEYKLAQKDVTNYLSNPINAFKLIKRLHLDWKMTEQNILGDGSTGYSKITNESVVPNDEDMSGAVEGLIRLQDLYHLDAAELSEGVLNGIKESSPMSLKDCIDIGIQAFILEYYAHAARWLSIALSKYEKESNDTSTKIHILDYLSYSYFKIGDIVNAINTTRDLLLLEPTNLRQANNLAHYENLKLKSDSGEPIQAHTIRTYYFKNYAELCRDELNIPENIKKNLKCRYQSKTSPFLRLAPVKLEEYYLDPYIVVFHDIIYDHEINYLKETATPRIQRARVITHENSLGLPGKFRVSKSGWIKHEEHEIMRKINQRISDVTGLSLEFAEDMQVGNYGIGGHYDPHTDFSKNLLQDPSSRLGLTSATSALRMDPAMASKMSAREKTDTYGFSFGNNDPNGNRIATFMFYLSDVAQGGRTVFPEIGVGATPQKGSAIFWINLHSSGEGDYATLHAACPVLQGDKWVANKWIRQRGQEFRRLCDLEFTDEGLKKKYPEPISKLNLTNKI